MPLHQLPITSYLRSSGRSSSPASVNTPTPSEQPRVSTMYRSTRSLSVSTDLTSTVFPLSASSVRSEETDGHPYPLPASAISILPIYILSKEIKLPHKILYVVQAPWFFKSLLLHFPTVFLSRTSSYRYLEPLSSALCIRRAMIHLGCCSSGPRCSTTALTIRIPMPSRNGIDIPPIRRTGALRVGINKSAFVSGSMLTYFPARLISCLRQCSRASSPLTRPTISSRASAV
jgi:hypothetical protein